MVPQNSRIHAGRRNRVDFSRLDPGTIPKQLPSHAKDFVEGCAGIRDVAALFVDPPNRYDCYLTSVTQSPLLTRSFGKACQRPQNCVVQRRDSNTGLLDFVLCTQVSAPVT